MRAGIVEAFRPSNAERSMFRPILAVCAILLTTVSVRAGDPKPLWEIATSGNKTTAPCWLRFSPDGTAAIAVFVEAGQLSSPGFTYTLRVWDVKTRKERFSAGLGTGNTPTWGDEFVSFPTDDTILTGGQSLIVRDLTDGNERTTQGTGGLADHAVWFARDLQETYHLRREPDREGKPARLLLRTARDSGNEFSSKRFRGDYLATLETDILPPRPGLRPQSIALNPGRSRLVAAFRDDSTGTPRHSLMHYRINTVDEFNLERVAEATNPHGGVVNALTFAQDGKTLATGGEDGSICLWDVKNSESSIWNPRATILAGDHRVVSVAFSPDWRVLAAITWDTKKPNLYLIDADSGRMVRSVKLDRDLTTVTWSADGRTLVTGGYSGKLSGWDVASLMK